MKLFKKLFKRCLQLFVLVIALFSAISIFNGYNEYSKKVEDNSIENVVNDIRMREDYIKIEDVSKDFLAGIVSIEDKRFLEHSGIDYISVCRAIVNNLKAGEIIEGGSTITQQLAKNMYFDTEQSLSRKIAEFIVAKKIENSYSKHEILELYINLIYYGNDYYGINQASKGYFNKRPSELNLEEATILAGLPQAPSLYNPKKNLDAAKRRQEYVIESMEKNGYLKE